MNKEEYIDSILLENDRLYKENQQLKERINMTININRKNKELHNKIDKAIEYIEAEGTTFLNFAGQRTWCGKHDADRILKILKDSDTDE